METTIYLFTSSYSSLHEQQGIGAGHGHAWLLAQEGRAPSPAPPKRTRPLRLVRNIRPICPSRTPLTLAE
jgi:hypothetical protein